MNITNAMKPGYKHTTLGWIPQEWEVREVGQVVDIFVGRDLKEDCYSDTQDATFKYPVYSNTVENEGLYGYYNFQEYTGESLTVIGRGAGLGTTFTRTGAFGAIGRLLVLFPKENYNAHYITEYFNGKIRLFTESSGIPQLTGEAISRYKMAFPPCWEQDEISTVLSTWDEAIKKAQELIEQLKLRNKGLSQQLLSGKKRLAGSNGHWVKKGADEIFKGHSQKNNGNEPLLSVTQDRGAIPRDMLEGRVTMPDSGTEGYKLVEPGNFIISLRSFQGGLEYSEYRGLVSPAYTVLKPALPIDDQFYRYYFKSYDFIGHLAVAVIGIRDGKQISFDDFCVLRLPYPSLPEQKAIAVILNKANGELKLYEQQLANLQKQKKGLMQKLLSGEVRVTTAN